MHVRVMNISDIKWKSTVSSKQQERQLQETCLRYAIAKLVVGDLEKCLLGITLDSLHFLNVIVKIKRDNEETVKKRRKFNYFFHL